jgi:hypothetical protein
MAQMRRLDRKVVNLSDMTDVLDEFGKLAEREFGPVRTLRITAANE